MAEIHNAQWPANITAIVALLTLCVTVVLRYADGRARAHERLLELRRGALLSALQLIDHVLANRGFNGQPPLHPHKWDIQFARDVDNQMRIYNGDLQTRKAFAQALGLYNHSVSKPPVVTLQMLDAFRRQVARELDLPEPVSDPDMIWITNIPRAE